MDNPTREIKFRAVFKNDDGSKVVSANSFTIDELSSYDVQEWEFSDGTTLPFDDVEKGDLEYMQFTGLKDKNGKEIYEGDIVSNNNEIWDIYYVEGAWKMGFNGKRKDNDHFFLLEPQYSEVIGNIYENSELLKGE